MEGKYGDFARGWLCENSLSEIRAMRFLERDHRQQPLTQSHMKTWHRLCNLSDGKFLRGLSLDMLSVHKKSEGIVVSPQWISSKKANFTTRSFKPGALGRMCITASPLWLEKQTGEHGSISAHLMIAFR